MWILLSCSVWEVKGSFSSHLCDLSRSSYKAIFSVVQVQQHWTPTCGKSDHQSFSSGRLMSLWEGSSGKPGLISHVHPLSDGDCAFRSALRTIKAFFITAFGLPVPHWLPKSLPFFFCWVRNSCFQCWIYIMSSQLQPVRIFLLMVFPFLYLFIIFYFFLFLFLSETIQRFSSVRVRKYPSHRSGIFCWYVLSTYLWKGSTYKERFLGPYYVGSWARVCLSSSGNQIFMSLLMCQNMRGALKFFCLTGPGPEWFCVTV